jgi:hypothetical protein
MMQGVGKHWVVELFGENIIRLRLFSKKLTKFFVPYYFYHMMCVAECATVSKLDD